MTKKNDHWMVGYNSNSQKFVPTPIFGDKNYQEVKAECDRLNKIRAEAKKK